MRTPAGAAADLFADAKPGDGATYTIWTDSHAGTISRRTAKTIWWKRDNAELLNGPESGEADALKAYPGGFAGHVTGVQRYRYDPDPEAPEVRFTRRVTRRGGYVWKRAGSRTDSEGSVLRPGRHEHYDYNF